jgi:hypothetical protein
VVQALAQAHVVLVQLGIIVAVAVSVCKVVQTAKVFTWITMVCLAQKAAADLVRIKAQLNAAVVGMLTVLAGVGGAVTAALAALKVLLLMAGSLSGARNYTALIPTVQFGVHVHGSVTQHHVKLLNKTGGILLKFAVTAAQA